MSARIACTPALFLALFGLVDARVAQACAGCRNPSLPVVRGGEGPLSEGALALQAGLSGTTVHVVHEAGCRDESACDELPVQPLYLHDQHLYPLELRFTAEYGLSDRFGLELQFSLRSVTSHIHYTTPEGAPYEPLDEGNHHRDETIAGPGDPWLLFRAGTTLARFWAAARLGVSLPLGSTEEDPFERGDQGLRHQHIQLGTGTFDPVLVIELSRRFEALSWELFAQGQASVYENRHGYRAPHRIYAGTALGRPIAGPVAAKLGVDVSSEGKERWNGQFRQDGNLGRTEILAAAQLSVAFGDTDLRLGARVPVFRHVVRGDEPPGTLSSPLALNLTVATLFGNEP